MAALVTSVATSVGNPAHNEGCQQEYDPGDGADEIKI
jgi:hypothetical protein